MKTSVPRSSITALWSSHSYSQAHVLSCWTSLAWWRSRTKLWWARCPIHVSSLLSALFHLLLPSSDLHSLTAISSKILKRTFQRSRLTVSLPYEAFHSIQMWLRIFSGRPNQLDNPSQRTLSCLPSHFLGLWTRIWRLFPRQAMFSCLELRSLA